MDSKKLEEKIEFLEKELRDTRLVLLGIILEHGKDDSDGFRSLDISDIAIQKVKNNYTLYTHRTERSRSVKIAIRRESHA